MEGGRAAAVVPEDLVNGSIDSGRDAGITGTST